MLSTEHLFSFPHTYLIILELPQLIHWKNDETETSVFGDITDNKYYLYLRTVNNGLVLYAFLMFPNKHIVALHTKDAIYYVHVCLIAYKTFSASYPKGILAHPTLTKYVVHYL